MSLNDSRLLAVQAGGGTYPSTPGAVVAADYLSVFDVSPTKIEAELLPRTAIDSEGGEIFKPATARVHATIEFSCYLSTSGSLGVAPSQGKLLEACGLNLTTVVGTSCTYSPATLNSQTGHCHLTFNHGGNDYKFLNAMGNAVLNYSAGALPFVRYSMKGFYEAPAVGAVLTPTYPNQALARQVDAANTPTFTMGTLASPIPLNFTEFTLDFGNEVNFFDNGGANGKFFRITSRKPTASLAIIEPALSVYNVDELFRNQTEQRLQLVHLTGQQGITVVIPRCTLDKFGDGDQNNVITRNGNLTILHDPGALNHFSIALP